MIDVLLDGLYLDDFSAIEMSSTPDFLHKIRNAIHDYSNCELVACPKSTYPTIEPSYFAVNRACSSTIYSDVQCAWGLQDASMSLIKHDGNGLLDYHHRLYLVVLGLDTI